MLNGFVNLDDALYLSSPEVASGLTGRGIAFAFTSVTTLHQHPLTWIVHEFNVELYGSEAAGHHLTSVLLHAFSAGLLLLILIQLGTQKVLATGGALLWALHPLRVESFAWAAELKDVLCAFFSPPLCLPICVTPNVAPALVILRGYKCRFAHSCPSGRLYVSRPFTTETLAPASSWTSFTFTFAGPSSCPGPVMMTLGGGQPEGAVYFDDVSISSPAVSSGANELGNPGFTNLTVTWQSGGGGPLLTQTTAHSGTTSLLLPASSWLGQTVTGLTPNGSYTLSAYLSGGQGTLTAGSGSTTVTASSGWTQVEVTGVASSSGTLAITAASSGGGTVYWDDFSINGTSASGGQEFGYDGFGNLLSQTPIFGSAPMMSLSVNPSTNQVTSGGAVYDGAGNMTQNGSATNLTYDEMNRMIAHQSAQNMQEYTYSPGENRRVMVYSNLSPATVNLFLYGPNGRVLSSLEYQKSGSNWVAVGGGQTNYLYLGSKVLNYAENNIGSTTTATTFWPYGQTNTGIGGVFGTYLADPSGFLYADQRYYNQSWGRFITPDPSNRNIDRTVSGSFNRYVYVNGDPVNLFDPFGLGNSPPAQICSISYTGSQTGPDALCNTIGYTAYSVGFDTWTTPASTGLGQYSTAVITNVDIGAQDESVYAQAVTSMFWFRLATVTYPLDAQTVSMLSSGTVSFDPTTGAVQRNLTVPIPNTPPTIPQLGSGSLDPTAEPKDNCPAGQIPANGVVTSCAPIPGCPSGYTLVNGRCSPQDITITPKVEVRYE